jgi:hypothetical protein
MIGFIEALAGGLLGGIAGWISCEVAVGIVNHFRKSR